MYRNTAVSAKSHKKSSKTASPQPYAPFSTILASFSTAATVARYRIPRELQGLYGERRRRERERERESNGRTKTRQKPPRTFSTDKKKKLWHPGKSLPVIFNTFLFASREFTQPVLRDHLVERLLCDYLGYCVIIIAFCIISNSHNH